MIDDWGLATALLVNGLVAGAVLSLMAVGFAVIYAATGHFHIAQAAVFGVAGYALYAAMDGGLNLVTAVVLALVCGALFGLLLERGLYRPLERRQTSRLMILIASLAVAIAADNVLAIAFSPDPQLVSAPDLRRVVVHRGSVTLSVLQVAGLVAGVAGIVSIALFLSRSRQGRAISAAADNPALALCLGLPVAALTTRVYFVGSLLAAAAGIYSAFDAGAEPGRGLGIFLTAAIAVIAGGVGSVLGAATAAFAIGVVQNLSLLWLSPQWTTTVVFALFIVWIVAKPEGLAARGARKS